MFIWNLLIAFLLSILPLALYAMRKKSSPFELKIIFTDNIVRIVAALVIIVIGTFVLTYVPELNELLTQSGILVGSATAGAFGFFVGSSLVALLPSDSNLNN